MTKFQALEQRLVARRRRQQAEAAQVDTTTPTSITEYQLLKSLTDPLQTSLLGIDEIEA